MVLASVVGVLRRLDLRERRDLSGAGLRAVLPRQRLDVAAAVPVVAPLVADVAGRGAAAVKDATRRFDGVDLAEDAPLRVGRDRLAAALAALDPALRAALQEATDRARRVHADQRRPDVVTRVAPGAVVRERFVPVDRVGLYVPGGLTVYPSSVVMNVVPAQEAGVASVAVASPPQRSDDPDADGWPHPVVLAACALLGVEEVWRVGGAQAVAALAHGLDDDGAGSVLEPVDVVTGPGNVYVTAAKRLLADRVGIDAEAGTTEVAVLADDGADPAHVAADLVAQAEHDPGAGCLLVTDSEALAAAVDAALEVQVPATRHVERVRTALAGQGAAVLVADLDHGLEVVDAFAAEHLEVLTRDAPERAARVRHAGAVFVGAYAPVSLGDYLAGSNHVLPTGGAARRTGGLSVATFLRGVHEVTYDRDALAAVAPHVEALGTAEDLLAHVEAVAVRLRDHEAVR